MMDIIRNHNQLAIENVKQEIRSCNEFSKKFGLVLSEEEINELVQCRSDALKSSGRVEFGGGILPKLIYAFAIHLIFNKIIMKSY